MQNTSDSRPDWSIDLPQEITRWRYLPFTGQLIITAPHREVGEFWIAFRLQEIVEKLPTGVKEVHFQAEGWFQAYGIDRAAPAW